MRRALGWLTGLIGLAALARYLYRRRSLAEHPAVDQTAELQRTLRRVRGQEAASEEDAAREEGTAGEEQTAGEQLGEQPASLEERRARLREKARAALEEMREPPEGA
jgi:hypothetical protein